jgi:hypothetical protein
LVNSVLVLRNGGVRMLRSRLTLREPIVSLARSRLVEGVSSNV